MQSSLKWILAIYHVLYKYYRIGSKFSFEVYSQKKSTFKDRVENQTKELIKIPRLDYAYISTHLIH